MDKKDLIEYLRYNVYCRLMPSKIHGVGVFAIKPIPKGIKVFKNESLNFFLIDKEDLIGVDDNVKNMINDFFVAHNNKYIITSNAFKELTISQYINHSDSPNIDIFGKISLCDIKIGEELTADYSLITNENNFYFIDGYSRT